MSCFLAAEVELLRYCDPRDRSGEATCELLLGTSVEIPFV